MRGETRFGLIRRVKEEHYLEPPIAFVNVGGGG